MTKIIYKHTPEELKALQNLPQSTKIARTLFLIKEFYDHHKGGAYVAFSGGKDSTVRLELCRHLYPEITAVSCDTGLEYPENRAFAKTIDNVTVVKPKIPFTKVLGLHGYPIISKKVAKIIKHARRGTPWAVNALASIFFGFLSGLYLGKSPLRHLVRPIYPSVPIHAFYVPKHYQSLKCHPFSVLGQESFQCTQ